MIDTILSVVAVLLLLFLAYAVVMCLWVAKQAGEAEKAFWEAHDERVKAKERAGKETYDAQNN